MVKHLYNKADKVVSLSKGVEKDLVSNFGLEPQKNCTIYNCYNLQKMKMLANSEDNVLNDLGENEVCFISMGRFTYQKGGWHLIRAFAKLVHDGYKCKLVLLGTGELKEYYEKLVSHEVTPKFAEAPERLRRLTINETRRIQTFPDDYVFCGAKTSVYKQIGNAVPCNMAKAVATAVSEFLNS